MTLASDSERGTSARAASFAQRAIGWSLVGAVLFGCAVVGFAEAFCSFKYWDDEGYFLLALRAYQEHGGLYESIRTVFYGPVYFQIVTAIFDVVGHRVDSAGARWLMLGGWFAALLAAGWITWRLNKSFLAAALAIAISFAFLVGLSNEPLHATSVILLLLAPLLVLTVLEFAPGRRPRTLVLAICGALCAAIALVKLNVGLFLLLAFVTAFAALPCGSSPRVSKLLRCSLALALVGVPFVLMRPLLSDERVLDFALLVAAGIAPFAIDLVRRAPPPGETWSGAQLCAFFGGAAALGTLSIGLTLLDGTTLSGLWRSLISDAASFPSYNHSSPNFPPRPWFLAGAYAVLLALFLKPGSSALVALQLLSSAFVLVQSMLMPQLVSIPLIWLVAGAGNGSRPRTFLGLASVLSVLQAYPIAGCQLALFSFLCGLTAVDGLWAALRASAWRERFTPWIRLGGHAALAIAVFVLLWFMNPTWSGYAFRRTWWERSTPFDLPGAELMRSEEMVCANLGWVAANLCHNSSTFIGVPGYHSLYAWSELDPPLPFYPHHWVLFRRAEEEEALARALQSTPRICVVRNDQNLRFWGNTFGLVEGPVKRVLDADFELAATVGEFELLFRKSEQPEFVLTAVPLQGYQRLFPRTPENGAFVMTLPAKEGREVSRFVLCDSIGAEFLDSAAPAAERRLRIADMSGKDLLLGASPSPLDAGTPLKLCMLWPKLDFKYARPPLLVRALDPKGVIVARILFLPPP